MHYFFSEEKNLKAGHCYRLKGEDYRHAAKVLRLRPGEKVALASGRGDVFLSEVSAVTEEAVEVNTLEALSPAESALNITLAQGMVKGEKFDLVVRQAVELGVKCIQPLLLERSIPRRNEKQEEKRLKRWQAIVRSASMQCRRAYLATVKKPLSLEEFLKEQTTSFLIVPWEGEKTASIKDLALKGPAKELPLVVIIGPEGGFSKKETDLLEKAGAFFLSLGPRILRSETASVVTLALLQEALGDLG